MGWEDPWERAWQSIPVFLPGESLGQRSLVDYSPYGCKEADTTEVSEHACTQALLRGRDSEVSLKTIASDLICL